jgi:hypothetical protein
VLRLILKAVGPLQTGRMALVGTLYVAYCEQKAVRVPLCAR